MLKQCRYCCYWWLSLAARMWRRFCCCWPAEDFIVVMTIQHPLMIPESSSAEQQKQPFDSEWWKRLQKFAQSIAFVGGRTLGFVGNKRFGRYDDVDSCCEEMLSGCPLCLFFFHWWLVESACWRCFEFWFTKEEESIIFIPTFSQWTGAQWYVIWIEKSPNASSSAFCLKSDWYEDRFLLFGGFILSEKAILVHEKEERQAFAPLHPSILFAIASS